MFLPPCISSPGNNAYIRACPHTGVDRGNLVTLLAAAAVVSMVLLLAHSLLIPPTVRVTPEPTPIPTLPPATPSPSPPPPTPAATPQGITPTRITYTGQFSSYPVLFIPSDMSPYGAPDAPWQFNSSVRFAYLEESHGGFTTIFTVPYRVWRINCTVSAWRSPEEAHLRLLLVDAETGTPLEGIEVRNPGTVVKNVQSRFRPLYLIVSTEQVDRVFISLETPADFL